jgi:hypothetical protein
MLWWSTAVVGLLATAGFTALAPAIARRSAAAALVSEFSQPSDNALVSESARGSGRPAAEMSPEPGPVPGYAVADSRQTCSAAT